MKNRKVMILAAAAVALASCGGNAPRRSAQQETGAFKPDIHNAETSLDYRGTYRGVLPAAIKGPKGNQEYMALFARP